MALADSEENESEAIVWTRRMRLLLAGVRPGARYNLPFFAHRALGSVCFTKEDGEVLRYCEDLVYKAEDHRMLWIDYAALNFEPEDKKEETQIILFLYIARPENSDDGAKLLDEGIEASESASAASSSRSPRLPDPTLRRQDEVLLLADFFRDGLLPDGSIPGWSMVDADCLPQRHLRIAEPPGQVSVRLEGGLQPPGGTLRVDPAGSEVLLTHPSPLQRIPGRMQLRAHFWDCGEEGARSWLGLTASTGAFAVGLHPHAEGHYACFCTEEAEGGWGTPLGWQKVKTARSPGWHVWELVLQEKWLSICIDGKIMGGMPVPVLPGAVEQICLGTQGSCCAYWGGVELLHTPFGNKIWDCGVQAVHPERPFTWRPWRVRDAEAGSWILDAGSGVIASTVVPCDEKPLAETAVLAEDAAAPDLDAAPAAIVSPVAKSRMRKKQAQTSLVASPSRAERKDTGQAKAKPATWRPTL